MKQATGDSTSEDEELDVSPVEIDESLVIEDDDHEDVLKHDSLPLCMADRVHDVKLGDSAEDSAAAPAASDSHTNPASGTSSRSAAVSRSDPVDFRSGASYGSSGTMSLAAAAMAGLGSANGRDVRGGRDQQGHLLFGSSNEPPKLIVTAGGKHLNRHLMIYQAIQYQLVLDEDDEDRYAGSDFIASDGSRPWSDIYTITYQRADSQTDRMSVGGSGSAAPSKSGSANSNSDAQSHRISRLDIILQGEFSCDLEKSNVEEFINGKLTPKLARQIQDALAMRSGSLPPWFYRLTKACPFLFPFEARRQFFYSTAFGLSRALYRLQQQQGADGHGSKNERELRIGEIRPPEGSCLPNRILDYAAMAGPWHHIITNIYSS